MEPAQPKFRIGHGYDLHRLEPITPQGSGKPFVLGGVHLKHNLGPVGHSDGDAVYHAVTDAILGALGQPDIGQLFPDDDPKWKDENSARFITEAVTRMKQAGYVVSNLDITVICERPKLSGHKIAMIENLARLLLCPVNRVNLKGKTHEQVDAVGRGEAVEVHTVVLIVREE